jgi:hypothetical protein
MNAWIQDATHFAQKRCSRTGIVLDYNDETLLEKQTRRNRLPNLSGLTKSDQYEFSSTP